MIASRDVEALNAFEQLLTTLSGPGTSNVREMTVFYLKHAKAAAVAEVLEQVFGGGGSPAGPGGGGGVVGDLAQAALGNVAGGLVGSLLGGGVTPTGPLQITPDSRLNALIVRATPADLDMVEELLKILDQRESPEDILAAAKARLIPVYNTQAEEIAQVVRQVYQDRMVGSSGSGGGGQPSPQQFIEMLRGMRGGRGSRGGGQQTEVAQKMSIGVDPRSNSLIVSAPDTLFQEVKQLVDQLDQAAVTESNEVMEVVKLDRASPFALQQALSAVLGSSVQVSGASSPRPSGSTTSPSPTGSPFGGFGGRSWRNRSFMPGQGSSTSPFPQSPMMMPGGMPQLGFPGFSPGGSFPGGGFRSGRSGMGGSSSGFQRGGFQPGQRPNRSGSR